MASGDGAYGGRGTEKPCRACMDFKSWAKLQKNTVTPENVSQPPQVTETKAPENCPLNKDELGSHTWSFLHTMAAYYPDKPTHEEKKDMKEFFTIFSRFYPCDVCAEDLRSQLTETPPQTSSREELSQWLCRIHNKINRRLGKSEFDCSKVDERWRTGWKDGSCD